MPSVFAMGLSSHKLCILENVYAETVDYRDVDFSFIDDHWSGWLRRLPDGLSERAFEYLTHKITRSPQDLRAHVHRIVSAYHWQRIDALYGALLDLFIVLGQQGGQLRSRLLAQFASALTFEQALTLKHGLKRGITDVGDIPQASYSCFYKGLEGYNTLVEQIENLDEFEFSILEEAHALVDAGYFEEARMILEEAVYQQPGDEALNRALLELYRYTRNSEALLDAKKRFQGLDLAMSDRWRKLEENLLMDTGVVD